MCGLPRLMVMLTVTACPTAVLAADSFHNVPVRELTITEGKLPTEGPAPSRRAWRRIAAMAPYALLDGEGEVYVEFADGGFNRWARSGQLVEQSSLAVRLPEGEPATGRLFFPNADGDQMAVAKFAIAGSKAGGQAHQQFHQAKRAHYQRLLARRIPGAAWFRHQIHQANLALDHTASEADDVRANARNVRTRESQLVQTYALFSGGRAMSENLQLDRVLPTTKRDEPTVPLESITGITVGEIDWKEIIEGLDPELDPLARRIPADQHAVFFPSFQAAVKMSDDAARQGTPVLHLAEPRSEDARTLARYEQQMCLSLDAAARLLGPRMAKSVALTGSDPYYRTGTDVAVLFETANPALLEGAILARVNLAAKTHRNAKLLEGDIGGLVYHGVRTPNRGLSSYVAALDGAVAVSNSLHQLKRLVGVERGKTDSIASLPEFVFFRDRYKLGDEEETALVFLSDAAIRRWCGPRWRIATSRRTRDIAVIAELQASHMDRLVRGDVHPGPIYTDLPIAGSGKLILDASGVTSTVHGTLAFMTPIAELEMDRVTQAEARAYQQWRDRYQRNWRWSFDPIALRLGIRDNRLTADLTVMPLIWGTDYREMIAVSREASFDPHDGDPHHALAHAILAINTNSQMFQTGSNIVSNITQGVSLSWLGDSVAVYVDDDPFWNDLAEITDAQEREEFLENEFHRLPIAVRAEVTNGLKLTVFLASLRAFIEQTSPDMIQWEALKYKDQSYVKVSPTEAGKRGMLDDLDDLAIYYAPSADSLVVTLSESVLKRAMDRRMARREAETEGKPIQPAGRPWLGSNLGLQVDRKILQVVNSLSSETYQAAMQARCWGNLPILNHWKRHYPQEDPVELHQRIWHVRLVCPGGGEYVWNEDFQTMESTVYGHPCVPQPGPATPPVLSAFTGADFGLDFEEQGLRARVSLERETN